MFTMYGDYLNMWLLHNIKTMQIYTFTHNPVLLLFVHQPDRVSGRFIANRLINVRIKIFFIKGDGNVVSFALLCTLLFTMLLKILITAQSWKARVISQCL